MSTLHFSDGLRLDTSGPLRLSQQSDGLYVIGQGMLIPVRDVNEGHQILRDLQNEKAQPVKKVKGP